MSSPERGLRAACRAIAGAGLALALTLGGCTVQPLYSSGPVSVAGGVAATLASVAVEPVTTRQALEVRNQLIFLLSGGAGNPERPAYSLDLAVSSTSAAAAVVQVTSTEEAPTSSLLIMNASYTLRNSATGEVAGRGRRTISAAYDVPRQQFAALRSQRDAENRAARELAEQLRLAIAQHLAVPR